MLLVLALVVLGMAIRRLLPGRSTNHDHRDRQHAGG